MRRLGIQINWLYETLVSTIQAHGAHAAPFGVRILRDNRLSLTMFKGTRSLESVLLAREFAVHLVNDPAWFFKALHGPAGFDYTRAVHIRVPVIAGLPGIIEARVLRSRDLGKTVNILAEAVHVHCRQPVFEPFNRARGLVMESLILSTRKALMPKKKLAQTLQENLRVVRKVAPASEFQDTMEALIADCLS